jgi:anti-sigma regulatory factor (Ser/Thr protein kinase)
MMRNSSTTLTEMQIPSHQSQGARVRKVIARLAQAALRDSGAVDDVELAIGEAFSNAVKYGAEDCKVSLRMESPASREVSVEMAYPGRCFDTSIEYPQDILTGGGGFGRYIINKITDGMEYSFENGCTTLRITKRCP